MNPPFLLITFSLLFWGWQTELWMFAIPMAIILEGARFAKVRWEFSLADFSRISDVCTLIITGMVVWLLISDKPNRIIFILIQWLPIGYFPMIAFQEYSFSGKVDIRALSLVLRKQDKKRKKVVKNLGVLKESPAFAVNIIYPYIILCIISASAANVRTPLFYGGIILISAYALRTAGTERFSPIIWITLFIVAGFIGYIGQIGLRQLQLFIEEKGFEWFINSDARDADPYRSVTAIGDIGTLKLSDRILFRVKPEKTDVHTSFYLREASYNMYEFSRWFAVGAEFFPVQPEEDGTTWMLLNSDPQTPKSSTFTISSYLQKGKGLLKLPTGAFQVEQLPVLKMKINPLGAVRIEEGPALITYKVKSDSLSYLDYPPNKRDFYIPKKEEAAIRDVVKNLDIASIHPEAGLERIYQFFREKFRYSLTYKPLKRNGTPLTEFLLGSRAGHCEYFATAAAMLLRASGIPSRYAVGYLVHEFSPLEKQFIVRIKDAHAWTLVYINGAWRNFDTTPPDWMNKEADALSSLETVSDFLSWCRFRFSDWRWREGKDGLKAYLNWLLIPLILILVRRLYFRKKVRQIKPCKETYHKEEAIPGADSDFYQIEKRFNELGIVRYPWETFYDWFRRIKTAPLPSELKAISIDSLYPLLELHYRCRFDPRGITHDEKIALNSGVKQFLHQ